MVRLNLPWIKNNETVHNQCFVIGDSFLKVCWKSKIKNILINQIECYFKRVKALLTMPATKGSSIGRKIWMQIA